MNIAEEEASYFPVPLSSLDIEHLDFDLYLRTEGGKYVLFRARGTPWPIHKTQELINQGVKEVHICATRARYLDWVSLNIRDYIRSSTDPVDTKARLVFNSARTMASQVFEARFDGPALTSCRRVVEAATEFLYSEEKATDLVASLMSHSYSVYTHTVNVMSYTVLLGRRMGYKQVGDLYRLSLSAFLHDIGYRSAGKYIVEKYPDLSEAEWVGLREHPQRGVSIVKAAWNPPAEVLAVIQEHHERCDGSGFPAGRPGRAIHPLAKVVGLVDEFDITLAVRRRTKPTSSYEVLKELGEKIEAFDPRAYREFVLLLAGHL